MKNQSVKPKKIHGHAPRTKLSVYIKNDEKLKKILSELASFANHHANDGHETYRITLSHCIDPRIFIGFVSETFLILHYIIKPYIMGIISKQWFNKWIDVSNRDVAKEFRYDQKSNFLNKKC